MKQIAFINFSLPTNKSYGHIHFLNFWEKRSLADFDIICVSPDWDLNYYDLDHDGYNGKNLLNKSRSSKFTDLYLFWRNEFARAVNTKKTILIFMEACEDFYYYTGKQEFSGTGRNQKTTNIVSPYHPYDIFGGLKLKRPEFGKGMQISLAGKASPSFQSFWKVIEKYSTYEAFFDKSSFDTEILLTQKKGDGIVGGIYHYKLGGKLLILPVINKTHSDFVTKKINKRTGDEKSEWSDVANRFSGDFLSALVSLHDSFKDEVQDSSEDNPEWLNNHFFLKAHIDKTDEIKVNDESISSLQSKNQILKREIKEISQFYALLNGTGKPLEVAVRKALEILGFKVTHYDDGVSEYDVIFEVENNLFLGEVEGKEGQIDVKKISQLIRNVVEYISKHEKVPKGVLFGNAFRKEEPSKRINDFTEKCVLTSSSQNIVLVNTRDLFKVTKFFLENEREDLKKNVRDTLLKTASGVVTFPELRNKPNNI